jgi:predicted CoA-binding protein
MPKKALIDEFLSHKNLALIRAARAAKVRGVLIDEQLGSIGYTVAVAYLDEPEPVTRLRGPGKTAEGVIIAVPPPQAAQAVKLALDAGIPRVWLQNGCESKEAIALCEAKTVLVVHGACVLMYAEPVKSVHAIHRWVWKTFGLLAK